MRQTQVQGAGQSASTGSRDDSGERTATGWLEAFWLVALAVVPSVINLFSSSVFEPDKAATLRLLAGVAAGAGVIGAVANVVRRGTGELKALLRSPLVLAAVLYVAWALVASLLSIDAPRSLLGTVQRGRGWLTMAAEFVAFLAIATGLRHREQFNRMMAAVVIGSVPVAMLAVMQRFGVTTPVGGAEAFSGRTPTFLGNPIFAGSYICIVLPVCVWLAWERIRRREALTAVVLGGYACVLCYCLLLTGSRGPVLAFAGSLAAGGVLLLLSMGYRRIGTWLALVGVLTVGLGTGVMLQKVSPDALARASTENAENRMGTVQVRLWVYRAVSARMRDHEPIEIRDVRDDHAALRWLTGYGPQCLAMGVDKYFPPELEQLEREGTVIDAAHSRLLEVWAEMGLAGIMTYAGLIATLFLAAFRALGWGLAHGRKRLMLASLLVGAGLTSAAFTIWWGWFAWALGALVGMAMGIPLYLLLASAQGEPAASDRSTRGRRVAGVAVTTALLAVVVDGQFGVQTVAAGFLFWCLAGVMVALPRIEWRGMTAAERRGFDPLVAAVALVAGCALMAELMLNSSCSKRLVEVFGGAVMGQPTVFAGSVALFGVVLALRNLRAASMLRVAAWCAGGACVLALVALLNSWLLVKVLGGGLSSTNSAAAVADGLIRISLVRMGGVVGAALLLSLIWPAGERRLERWSARGAWLVSTVLLLPVMAICVLQILRPEVRLSVAQMLFQQGDSESAAALADQAAAGPIAGHVLSEQHLMYGELAQTASDPGERESYLGKARRSIDRAIAAAPFDSRHYDRLGGVLQVAAMYSRDETRRLRAEAALQAFDESLQLAPGRTSVRMKQARIASGLLGSLAREREILLSARRLDATNPDLSERLALVAFAMAKQTRDATERQELAREAAESARFALDAPRIGNVRVETEAMQTVLSAYRALTGVELNPVPPSTPEATLTPRLGMAPLAVLQWVVAFGLAMLLTPTVRCLAPRLGMIDMPAQRKAHVTPTPLMGGAAIYLALTVAGLLAWPAWVTPLRVLMLCATALFIVGVSDDRWGLVWGWKMGVQVAAAAVLYWVGVRAQLAWLPGWVNVTLTMVWLVGITNGVNFLDNMDGLAAGVGAIAATGFGVMGAMHGCWDVAGISAALAGACIGFLRFNGWNATIFMGDAGSLVLGILLAGLGLVIRFPDGKNWVTWMAPVLVLGVPVLDTSLVVVSRLRRGVNPFATPGKDHVSHRLVQAGLTKSAAVACVWSAAVVCAAMGLSVTMLSPVAAYAVGGAYVVVYLGLLSAFETKLPYQDPKSSSVATSDQ